jgi:hypothetical protein
MTEYEWQLVRKRPNYAETAFVIVFVLVYCTMNIMAWPAVSIRNAFCRYVEKDVVSRLEKDGFDVIVLKYGPSLENEKVFTRPNACQQLEKWFADNDYYNITRPVYLWRGDLEKWVQHPYCVVDEENLHWKWSVRFRPGRDANSSILPADCRFFSGRKDRVEVKEVQLTGIIETWFVTYYAKNDCGNPYGDPRSFTMNGGYDEDGKMAKLSGKHQDEKIPFHKNLYRRLGLCHVWNTIYWLLVTVITVSYFGIPALATITLFFDSGPRPSPLYLCIRFYGLVYPIAVTFMFMNSQFDPVKMPFLALSMWFWWLVYDMTFENVWSALFCQDYLESCKFYGRRPYWDHWRWPCHTATQEERWKGGQKYLHELLPTQPDTPLNIVTEPPPQPPPEEFRPVN